MRSMRARLTRSFAGVLLAAGGLASCAPAPKPAPRTPPRAAPAAEQGIPPRPADADADVAYYHERAAALATESTTEVARTNFARMRRGRMYLSGEVPAAETGKQIALTQAFDKSDNQAIVDITGKILPDDQVDIRAHMLRAVALRRLSRTKEADFHREAAISLIESIVGGGDGRGFDTAWTVFRVKEEYEVLKARGYVVDRQSLTHHDRRDFDILDAHKPDGSEKVRAYFDITEMFAEEGRAFGAR
jgi:hypothetical protein